MATAKASSRIIDFSNVKERGNFNPKHIDSGDYEAKIAKVEDVEAKDGEDMWLFTFTLPEVPRATYPYYCKLVENQFWKIKTLFEAVGKKPGAKKANVNPNILVGKTVGVFIEDDEYEGRLKSVIADVFPVEQVGGVVEGDVEPEEDDLDEPEEAPAPKKRKRQPEPEPEEDEEEEDDEEEEEEEPEPPRKKAPAKKAPAKKTTATKRRRPAVEDEEDDEDLEIDEL